jgi:hypothetical protein
MQNRGPYYITTAIAYTSGKPHIGNSYEIVSPEHGRLMSKFNDFCEKYGIIHDFNECFSYLNELPEKYQQLTLF